MSYAGRHIFRRYRRRSGPVPTGGNGAAAARYVRDDVRANALLAKFLAQRAGHDPTGYIREWHSRPAPSGPSPTDVAAMRATAKTSDGPIALLVHATGGADPFFGLIARRQRFGRTTAREVTVSLPPPRFEPLGPLPDGAVRGDGPGVHLLSAVGRDTTGRVA